MIHTDASLMIDSVQPVNILHPLCPDYFWLQLPGQSGGPVLPNLRRNGDHDGRHGVAAGTYAPWPVWRTSPAGFPCLYRGSGVGTSYATVGALGSGTLRVFGVTAGVYAESVTSYKSIFGDASNTLTTNGGTLVWYSSADRSSGYTLSTGRWYHVGVTYDAVTLRFYVDGKFVGSAAYASAAFPFNAATSIMSNGTSNAWLGSIDHVQVVLNRTPSASEMADRNDQWLRGWPGLLNRVPRRVIASTVSNTFTATSALTVTAATLSATATFTAPVYTATGALSVTAATLAATATFATATFTASGALTTTAAQLNATATFTAPVYTATGSLTASSATLGGTATFSSGTFTGSGTLTTTQAQLNSTGSHQTPSYEATGALTSTAATLSGSAVFNTAVYSGTGALTSSSATLSASATFTAPIYTGTSVLTATAVTLSGSATFATDTFTGTGALTATSATLSGSATFVGLYTAIGALIASVVTLSGSATFEGTAVVLPPIVDFTLDFDAPLDAVLDFDYVVNTTLGF